MPVVPFLIAEVMACDIGGAATLIGHPPGIVIGSRADLSSGDFLTDMTPIVGVPVIVFVLVLRTVDRGGPSHSARTSAATPRPSRPRPTRWSPASPSARATTSRSGSSAGTD